MPEASTPTSLPRSEGPARQERAPRSDSSPRLLSDIVHSLRSKRESLPDVESAFFPHQGVILNFAAIERQGKQGRTQKIDVGYHWTGQEEGRLTLGRTRANAVSRALLGAVNRQGLPEDPQGVQRAFERIGVDSGVAVAPLLYSVVSRNPRFATETDYVNRAEELGVATVGSWDAGEGQRNGAILFAQGGRVIRIDTETTNLTAGDVVQAKEWLRRHDVQGLFADDDRAVRLGLSSTDEEGTAHRTLSYRDKTVDLTEASVSPTEGMGAHQAMEAIAKEIIP